MGECLGECPVKIEQMCNIVLVLDLITPDARYWASEMERDVKDRVAQELYKMTYQRACEQDYCGRHSGVSRLYHE